MSCMDDQASLASILSDDEETMISQVCQFFRDVALKIAQFRCFKIQPKTIDITPGNKPHKLYSLFPGALY